MTQGEGGQEPPWSQVLAKSHVMATFDGFRERRDLTRAVPPSRFEIVMRYSPMASFAEFTILENIEYEIHGSHSHGACLREEQSEELATIEALQPGELVRLIFGGSLLYLVEKAPKIVLTVAQGEQGQDGAVPITLITLAGEEAANFGFDGVPLLADVRSAASEALQLHPLQLEFVDIYGAILRDDGAALPVSSSAPGLGDGSAVPADMPVNVECTAPQLSACPQASAVREMSPATGPQAIDQPGTSAESSSQPEAVASTSSFLARQPQGCPMSASATRPSAFGMAPQPWACPMAAAAISAAPQPLACPRVEVVASSPSVSCMTAQPQPMAVTLPELRQISITAPIPCIMTPQSQATITPSLSFVAPLPQAYSIVTPGQISGACSMAPQSVAAPTTSAFGIIPIYAAPAPQQPIYAAPLR